MHDILREIVSKRMMHIQRIKAEMTGADREALQKRAKEMPRRIRISLKEALRSTKSDRAIITEFKRASPSKGDINTELCPQKQAILYEKAGAAAMSILTEPDYFKGSLEDIKAARRVTTLPILCKDFIVDPVQIELAKVYGADAILLIAAVLDDEQMSSLAKYARELDLDVLVESHNQWELLRALKIEGAIIGINNRNLKTFKTDIHTTKKLMDIMPKDTLVVSESGIKTVEDMSELQAVGASAFLVGETMMRTAGTDAERLTQMQTFTGCSFKTKVKICGLSRNKDIEMANEVEPDYVGFVFAKSKRQVTPLDAKQLIKKLKPSIRAVGVFVDTPPAEVEYIAQFCQLDVVQLHGKETVSDYITSRAYWKAVSVKEVEIETLTSDFEDLVLKPNGKIGVGGLLYDTYDPDEAGGTGKSFPWIKPLPESAFMRIAAGGINTENVVRCLSILKPDVIDVSSGVEENGFKSAEKVKQLVQKIRQA